MEGFGNFSVYLGNTNKPFVTLRSTTITFSTIAIEQLKYSKYVHMLVDLDNKKVAFKACELDEGAILFYTEERNKKQLLVRISGKDRIGIMMRLAGIEDCGKGIRFYGFYDQKNDALIFDMTQYNKED